MNLAHSYVKSLGKCVPGTREEYDGCCIDFAGDCKEWHGHGARLAHFETPLNPQWRYHAAMELNGVIHDLWQEQPIEIAPYMDIIGATAVEYF